MTLDAQTTAKVAKLAMLCPSDDELEELSTKLSSVLDYFEQLNQIDTEGVEPLSHPSDIVNVLAQDHACESYSRDEILSNAPQHDGEHFRVPAVIKQ